MGAKYSYVGWEQFADQASTIMGKLKLICFPGVQIVAGLWCSSHRSEQLSTPPTPIPPPIPCRRNFSLCVVANQSATSNKM